MAKYFILGFDGGGSLGANCQRVTVPLTTAVALDDTSDAAYSAMDTALTTYYGTQAFTDVQNWITRNFPTSG